LKRPVTPSQTSALKRSNDPEENSLYVVRTVGGAYILTGQDIVENKKGIGQEVMLSVSTSREFAFSLMQAARLHGEYSGELDHEAGDLCAFFLACWSVMTREQRARALSDPGVQEVIDGPEYVALFE
jgi:hypothetical protein